MWRDLTDSEYFDEFRTYLSSTDIRRILRSPAHFKNPQALDTPATRFGSLAHAFVLLQHVAEARYRPRADVDGRTKEGKAIRDWENSLVASQGVEFVSKADYDAAVSIATSVRTHLGCCSILAGGLAEVSGIVEGFCDINARIKPDYRTDSLIADVKTTTDARPDAFVRSIVSFGYAVQAAYYVDVAEAIDGKKRRFYWVAVEKDAPFAVAVYEASDAMLEYGRSQYRKAIELYKECASLDLWPAYSQQVQTLDLPGWVKE